jgi:hypothetical protein
MRTRDTPPPARPAPADEIGRASSVSRMFWVSAAAVASLAVVISLILLHQALAGAR